MLIEIEKLDSLVSDADKIFITPEAEEVLLQLLDLQKQIEGAIDEAKKKLEAKALELNPNFKSIRSDNLKVFYRQYGQKYTIDESYIKQIPAHLYKTKFSYTTVSKDIDAYFAEHGALPLGIIEKEREKSIAFSRREKGVFEGEE
jgi:hypothetical protein